MTPGIFLIRHGEAEQNVVNKLSSFPETIAYHLTPHGRRQVAGAVHQLQSVPVERIFASPMTRTRETAEIIAETVGAPISYDERLCESGFGRWSDDYYDTFAEWYPNISTRIRETDVADGVESMQSVSRRAQEFLYEVESRFRHKNIALVSHGDTLRMLYGALRGLSIETALQRWNPSLAEVRMVSWEDISLAFPTK
jgi:broad specificity phosphatase PhoE